ncbi:MAG: LysM peptidoglycan-binding domain-containing protein [Flavobacteriaceae bacterium]|nr:LysM peptidoglycan-binding domain-containing protein [Flavobacteriaceae bacterium]
MSRYPFNFLFLLLTMMMIGGIEFSLGQEKVQFKTHVVQRGEKVIDILKKHSITYEELIQYNSRLSRRVIRRGMKLKIPVVLQNQEIPDESNDIVKDLKQKINRENPIVPTENVSLGGLSFEDLDSKQIGRRYDLDFSELLYLYPDMRQGRNRFTIDTSKIETLKYLFTPSSTTIPVYTDVELDQIINKSLLPKSLIKLNPIIKDKSLLSQLFSIIDFQQNRFILDTLSEVERIEKETEYLMTLNQVSSKQLQKYNLNQTKLDQLFLNGIDIILPQIETKNLSVHEKIKSQFLSDIDLSFQKNEKRLKMALLLPINAQNFIESTHNKKIQDLNQSRNLTTISIDFLLGCELALETAQEFGAQVELVAFDTQNNQNTINQIITEEKIAEYDVIIGPLLAQNFNFLSSNPDLISVEKYFPISTRPVTNRPNVYHTQTSNKIIQEKLFGYIHKKIRDQPKNIFIVTDDANQEFIHKLKIDFPASQIIIPSKGNYLNIDSVLMKMNPRRLNLIILATDSDILYSNAISLFSSINQEKNDYQIQLINTSIINSFSMMDLLSQEYNNLDIVFPSLYRTSWGGYVNAFKDTYYNRYGKYPSLEAIRGYDLVIDIIYRHSLRQEHKSNENQWQSRVYNSFGFDYDKNDSRGFFNTFHFLLRYQNGQLVELVGDNIDPIW